MEIKSKPFMIQNSQSGETFAEVKGTIKGHSAQDVCTQSIQQHDARAALTTVQCVSSEFDFKKIDKDAKKDFVCSGTFVEHAKSGEVSELHVYESQNLKFSKQVGLAQDDQIKALADRFAVGCSAILSGDEDKVEATDRVSDEGPEEGDDDAEEEDGGGCQDADEGGVADDDEEDDDDEDDDDEDDDDMGEEIIPRNDKKSAWRPTLEGFLVNIVILSRIDPEFMAECYSTRGSHLLRGETGVDLSSGISDYLTDHLTTDVTITEVYIKDDTTEESIADVLDNAADYQPSVVLLHNIDQASPEVAVVISNLIQLIISDRRLVMVVCDTTNDASFDRVLVPLLIEARIKDVTP